MWKVKRFWQESSKDLRKGKLALSGARTTNCLLGLLLFAENEVNLCEFVIKGNAGIL